MDTNQKLQRVAEITDRMSELNKKYAAIMHPDGKVPPFIELTSAQMEEVDMNRQEHKRLETELLSIR